MDEAKHLQEKIPPNNMFLKMVSAIHAQRHGSTAAERTTRKLKNFFLNILDSDEQHGKDDRNVSNFHLAKDIPASNGLINVGIKYLLQKNMTCWRKLFQLLTKT